MEKIKFRWVGARLSSRVMKGSSRVLFWVFDFCAKIY